MATGHYGLRGHYAVSHVKAAFNLSYVIAPTRYQSMVVFSAMEVIKSIKFVIQQSAKVFLFCFFYLFTFLSPDFS